MKEILNQDVSYDEESRTLYVGGKGNTITKEALQDDYSILYNGKNYINLGSEKANSIKEPKVAGKELTQGFIIESNKSEGSYVLLRVDDRFSSIEFDVGMLDSTSEYDIGDAVMRIELDGKEKYKEKVPSQIASSHYQFDISGAKTLKIQLSDSYSKFGFYNVIFNKK